MKRILLVRTDRIGDVVLSTPAIKAIRDKYPDSYIGFMTRELTRDIIEGNPWLDEMFIFERDPVRNSWKDFLRTLKIAGQLRRRKFDTAIILNPTFRANLIVFWAGIPNRIGYNRKGKYLLTQKIEDKKWQGKLHEAEYTLEMLKSIGVDNAQKKTYMPIKSIDEQAVDKFLKDNGVKETDAVVCIQCGANCVSRIWPSENFAQVADKLIDAFGCKVFVSCGPQETHLKKAVLSAMKNKAIMVPDFSVGRIACLMKRSSLLISNDSGPVHIAVALETPVISIFSRNLPGLSPARWRPLGPKDVYLHKDVGCKVCLAHNCKLDFKCLKAITADEVFEQAEGILNKSKPRGILNK